MTQRHQVNVSLNGDLRSLLHQQSVGTAIGRWRAGVLRVWSAPDHYSQPMTYR